MNWGQQAGAFDETFEASGDVRPHYRTALSILQGFSADEIERRERLQKLSLLNQGITFTVYGEKDGIERIFPFDFVPRIIPAAEWRRIEAGLIQRITTLGLFLLDIYGEQKCLKDGILPAELVYSRKEYKRELLGVVPPRKIFVLSGITDTGAPPERKSAHGSQVPKNHEVGRRAGPWSKSATVLSVRVFFAILKRIMSEEEAPVLVIRRAQLDVLSTYAMAQYELRTARHLRARYPDRTRGIDDGRLLAITRNAVAEARAYKIIREPNVTRYTEYHVECGPDFVTSVLTDDVRSILLDERQSETYKMEVIEECMRFGGPEGPTYDRNS